MDWVLAQPDGEAVAGVEILGSVIVLAKMLIHVKNVANIGRQYGSNGCSQGVLTEQWCWVDPPVRSAK